MKKEVIEVTVFWPQSGNVLPIQRGTGALKIVKIANAMKEMVAKENSTVVKELQDDIFQWSYENANTGVRFV